jgi:osmotically-inducible protein OsmY
VDTTDGTVVLSGAVDNNAQQLEAVKVASEVKGVVNVTDNLALRVANDD